MCLDLRFRVEGFRIRRVGGLGLRGSKVQGSRILGADVYKAIYGVPSGRHLRVATFVSNVSRKNPLLFQPDRRWQSKMQSMLLIPRMLYV